MDNINGNSLTERHLVERVLGGDTQAFATLIRHTEKLVAHIVCKMISNREDQKDIVQEVYLKAFKKLATFRFKAQFSTWVAQIAYNSCLSFLEKKQIVVYGDWQGTGDADQDNQFDPLSRLPAGAANDPLVTLHQKERTALINSAVELLPPVFKLLVGLYHHEELSYQEIVQITQLPEGTIKSYLFRARKTLKEHLLHHFKNGEL